MWCRKAQRARIRTLAEIAATWGVHDPAPVAPAAPPAAGASASVLPNSDAAKTRAAAVHEDLMRRRADTQQQLRKYVQSGKISSEMAQQRMAEVDQVCPHHRCVPLCVHTHDYMLPFQGDQIVCPCACGTSA